MPSGIETPEYVQKEQVQSYREGVALTPEEQPAARSRIATLFASLRALLWPRSDWGATAHTPSFETGMDMLARKYPYSFIRSISG